jgi:chromosome segregation ATPase
MSDANFINTYNEVILENLNAIMKQNFMFQTQIKFFEQRVNEFPEMEKKLADFEKDKSVELKQYQSSTDKFEKKLAETSSDFEKKLAETSNDFERKLADKQNEYNRLMDQKNNLAGEVLSLKNEVEDKSRIIQNNVTSDNDNHRLQTAVNQQSGDIEKLKNKIESMEKEIDSHKKYNLQLEEMLPNSKKKKLGIEILEEDTPKVEVKKEQTAPIINATSLTFESAGGTF